MRIVTEHSEYVIDEKAKTLVRTPVHADAPGLRRDGEAVKFVSMEKPEMGERAVFLLAGLAEGGAFASRVTTPVLEIHP